MNKEQVVYKLCAVDWNNTYWSVCQSSDMDDKFKVQYILKEYVNGLDNSKLFVFDTLKNAISLKEELGCLLNDKYKYLVIFKAIGVNVRKPRIIHTPRVYNIANFWKLYKNKKSILKYGKFTQCKLPKGTLWCDTVKILERVF